MTTTYQRVISKQAARIERRLTQGGATCNIYAVGASGLADLTTPVESAIPCDIVGINTIAEPQIAEHVERMGYDPREFRLITLPLRILTARPTIGINWVIRTYPGMPAQQDYNVVEKPNTDESLPMDLTLQCMPLPPVETGA